MLSNFPLNNCFNALIREAKQQADFQGNLNKVKELQDIQKQVRRYRLIKENPCGPPK